MPDDDLTEVVLALLKPGLRQGKEEWRVFRDPDHALRVRTELLRLLESSQRTARIDVVCAIGSLVRMSAVFRSELIESKLIECCGDCLADESVRQIGMNSVSRNAPPGSAGTSILLMALLKTLAEIGSDRSRSVVLRTQNILSEYLPRHLVKDLFGAPVQKQWEDRADKG